MLTTKSTSAKILNQLSKAKTTIMQYYQENSHKMQAIAKAPTGDALKNFPSIAVPSPLDLAADALQKENDLYDQMEKGLLPIRITMSHP